MKKITPTCAIVLLYRDLGCGRDARCGMFYVRTPVAPVWEGLRATILRASAVDTVGAVSPGTASLRRELVCCDMGLGLGEEGMGVSWAGTGLGPGTLETGGGGGTL